MNPPQDNTLRDTDLRLGAMAVRAGHITNADLAIALKKQQELMLRQEYLPLGTILVESGKMKAETVAELLRRQTHLWGGQRVLGKYRLIEKIGAGGMGAVWKAEHTELGSSVAIKLLPRAVVGDAISVKRFHHETRIMATVNHTNIVQAFDAGEHDGQPFFVMPYLDGATLGDLLRKCGRLGVRTALSLALQIVRGLQYAHERGLVHRDLKPDNLFVTNDGTLKILDLGLSKLMEGAGSGTRSATLPGVIVGTPHYMSPEQILGDAALDRRSDIYSLGSTLFQMLCGRVPFEGEHVTEVLRLKIETLPPDPKELCPDLPNGVRKLILSMLARKPEDRPADCATLEAEIEALLDGKPVTGSVLSPGNIVLGASEKDTRTFSLSVPAPTQEIRTSITRREESAGPGSTTVLPRPPGLSRVREDRAVPPPPPDAPKPVVPPSAPKAAPLPPLPPPAGITAAIPAPPRMSVGWAGQLLAALVLVLVTVIVTLAVVRMRDDARRSPRPPVRPEPR